MKRSRWFGLLPVVAFGLLLFDASAESRANDKRREIDFARDVRPILAGNCYACHGPDNEARKAKLRLDTSEGAMGPLGGEGHAVVPGDPGKSRLISRIHAKGDDRMPPLDSGKELSEKEKEILELWISQGAEWKQHWVYIPPSKIEPPTVERDDWSRSAIDRFLLDRMRKEGLEPAERADAATLVRRSSFDLIGLPPSRKLLETYAAKSDQGAYESMIDELLASPHFGERMAIFWLDLVRFADTIGYHSDIPRNVTPYRDYVIRSFNENKRFDQFTIEQLAGDLIPNATLWQRVASCYNKLNQTTEEGGAQAKEYEAKNAADRVRNLSVVWMGATLGCAECHAHKFDPYSDRDFYSLAAFFSDIQEPAIMDRDKGIPVPSNDQEIRLAKLASERAEVARSIADPPENLAKKIAAEQIAWEERAFKESPPRFGPWHAIGPFLTNDPEAAFKTRFVPADKFDPKARFQEGKLAWREEPSWLDGKVHNLTGTNSATYLHRTVEVDIALSVEVSLGSDDGIELWLNGQSLLSKEVYRGVAPDQEKVKLPLRPGSNSLLMKITNGGGGHGFYFKPLSASGLPPEIRSILQKKKTERSESESKKLAIYHRDLSPLLAKQRAQLAALDKEMTALEKTFDRCVVSSSGKRRTVRIRPRGNWMDDSGNIVTAAIPAYFGKLNTGDRPATRMDLARWLLTKDNPLTARVFVNRLWKMLFGTGISSRLDDLGAMGEPPVHPELLDWLAIEFVESGWNVKHMIKILLMTSTYQQSSYPTLEKLKKDPANRLLSRQSRWRLDAEFVRDNALAVSGLLSAEIGGSSAKPYQPAGYWMHLNFPKRKWQADRGSKAHRRGLYTWWQRSFLHPSLMAFDAPNREECTAERPRSNIPQQALVLLNDPTYVEAARVFATHIVSSGANETERIRWGFSRTLSRSPTNEEIDILLALYRGHLDSYRADPKAAEQLLATGLAPRSASKDAKNDARNMAELAAWTSVARTLLNLHETVTRN